MTDHHDEMRVSPDPSQAEDLRQRLLARMARMSLDVHGRSGLDLDPTRFDPDKHGDAPATEDDVHRHPLLGGRPLVVALATVAVLALVAGAVALLRIDRDVAPITTDPALPPNGWVAFTGATEPLPVPGTMGDDVYLAREGESPRRVAGSDTDTSDQQCPAFSPDGGRLVFGQATVSYRSGHTFYDDAELVILEVGADGSTSGTTTIPVEDPGAPPCPLWSPDGRWLAFGAGSDPAQFEWDATEVRLVDTVTEEQRRLPGYAATDLEWLPGTDELAIADNGIHVYSVTTGEVRSLGIDGALALSWSPDGTTVAFTRVPGGGETNTSNTSIWLADADGTDERRLTGDYLVLQGIGPVWSPDGRSIAYNRSIASAEPSEVVLVTIADDADNPIDSETVIAPPTTPGPDGPVTWSNPRSVTWSPDGSTLLYIAWNDACTGGRASPNCVAQGGSSFAGVLAVPVDTTNAPFVLADPSWQIGGATWGRQPPD